MKPVLECKFDYKGYPCVVLFMPLGYRCGYVGTTEKDSDYYSQSEDVINLFTTCPVRITYSEPKLQGEYDGKTWWIGFDHGGGNEGRDWESAEYYYSESPDWQRLIKPLANICKESGMQFPPAVSKYEIIEECKRIIDQIVKE